MRTGVRASVKLRNRQRRFLSGVGDACELLRANRVEQGIRRRADLAPGHRQLGATLVRLDRQTVGVAAFWSAQGGGTYVAE